MTFWTSPASYTYHFHPAQDAPPHSFDDCDNRCRASVRQGWLEWVAEGAVAALRADMSVRQVAELLGVSEQRVSQMATGRHRVVKS